MHPEGANSMAVSGLRGRKVLVGTGKAISAVLGIGTQKVAVLPCSTSLGHSVHTGSRLSRPSSLSTPVPI